MNFPIDITFKSTNPYGWPRLVLSVYGVDRFGRDVIRGYGSIHIPAFPGTYTKTVPLFAPKAASLFHEFMGFINGNPPEVRHVCCFKTMMSSSFSFMILNSSVKMKVEK